MKFALGAHAGAVEARIEALTSSDAAARIWKRDATFWGGDAARQKSVANRLGWLDIAQVFRADVDDLNAFAASVREGGFRDAVLLGMGGSSLAPEVLRLGIRPRAGYPRLFVLDTTDPATIRAVEEAVDLQETLFFVSSKSGGTIEVASLFAYFHALVDAAKPGRAGENFVAITDAGTPLEALARKHDFLRTFTNPGDIGGRYSALSYFGLVPAAVAGIDAGILLDRAIAAGHAARQPDSDAMRLGAALGELALAGRNKCTLITSPAIASFGLWAEQLIAESTGKQGLGILPVEGEPMATPAMYGDDRVFVQLRMDGGYDGNADSVAGALVAEGQPVIVIDLDDAYDLGGEFVRWEFAIAVAGHVLGINPFDEPNVQESKDNTARVLRAFEESGALDFDGVDSQTRAIAVTPRGIDPRTLAGAVGSLLSELRPHDYFAITAYFGADDEARALLAEIRVLVRDAYGVATTLGYGPRFLHSTGQLHKGGPPKGVFLQLTAADARDMAVPGAAYTFGQLKRAQAIGDLQALDAHGRPVLRVHLGDDIATGLLQLRDIVRAATRAPMRR